MDFAHFQFKVHILSKLVLVTSTRNKIIKMNMQSLFSIMNHKFGYDCGQSVNTAELSSFTVLVFHISYKWSGGALTLRMQTHNCGMHGLIELELI